MTESAARTAWTFLTNHGCVLLCLASDPDARLRDIAARVGITERAVQKILGDLELAGIVTRTREGRRNHYVVHVDEPLPHPLLAHRSVGALVHALQGPTIRGRRRVNDEP
ncbi:MAG: winged helix-turn-helix domain-containing protein [Nannocystaceae bacterium]